MSNRSFCLKALALAAMVCLGGAGTALATVYYVDAAKADDTGDGLSWANAKRHIFAAAALAAAGTNNEVWVKAGTYNEETASSAINNGQKFYGSLIGTEAPGYDMGLRDFTANLTTVDGTGKAVRFINDATGKSNVRIDGFRIQNYVLSATTDYGHAVRMTDGGGNRCDGLVIANCVFFKNGNPASGADYGGAVYLSSAGTGILIDKCEFTSNSINRYGGAFSMSGNFATGITFRDCLFQFNDAPSAAAGALDINQTSGTPQVMIERCRFFENNYGGTIWQNPSAIRVMADIGSSITLANCTFSHNRHKSDGGIIYMHCGGNMNIINCSFDRNYREVGGGTGKTLWFEGWAWRQARVTMVNTIVSNHNHPTVTRTSGKTRLNNCIATSDNLYYRGNDVASARFEVQSGAVLTENGSMLDLADPAYVDEANGDLHLSNASPCIDVGTATGASLDDIDGESRPWPVAGLVDVGADENHFVPVGLSRMAVE